MYAEPTFSGLHEFHKFLMYNAASVTNKPTNSNYSLLPLIISPTEWKTLYGVPQERRRTVNPLRGRTEFLANELLRLTPNGGKQGGIPDKESPQIANNKSDLNRQQKELVTRRPRENSNKNPSGSKCAVPAKAEGNPRKESPFKLYA